MERRIPPEISVRVSVEMLETRDVNSLPPSQVSRLTSTTANATYDRWRSGCSLRWRNSTTAKNDQFDENGEHAPARAGKENRADHDGRGDAGGDAFFLVCQPRQRQDQRNGDEQFHQSGVVVVVHVGAVNPATHGGVGEPSTVCRWERCPAAARKQRSRIRRGRE